MFQDLRYAIRTLWKAPVFTITALAALALGIGANTAIFSVINTVLLKPMTFPDPDRVVYFYGTTPSGPSYGASATKFNVWRKQTEAFQDVSAYAPAVVNLTGGAYPEQIHVLRASANYFSLFGAPIVRGRPFSAAEDRSGAEHVVVISYGLWQRRFAADPQEVGRTITLSGVPYTVIGIVGSGFNSEFTPGPDVWLPLQIDPASTDQANYMTVAARLKPGVSVESATAQLQPAADEFRRTSPNMIGPRDGFAVAKMQEGIVADVRPSLLILAGAVSFVLLIACANVASLLLVRATGRQREIAIRCAIGAGRGRIVRQLLTESVLLSLFGGGLGLFIGLAGVRALLRLNPGNIPRIGGQDAAIALDWRLLLFTIAISLATGVLFGLIPALSASRSDIGSTLKEGGGRSGTGLRQNKTRTFLVIGEMALALVLLIGAALLIRSFELLRSVDPGIDTQDVLTMRMSLAGSQFQKTAEVSQLINEATQRVGALPGVAVVSASYNLPVEGNFGIPFNIVGRSPASGRYDGRGWIGVAPGYFDAFKIPILRGRAFNDRDQAGTAPVAIINEAMVRQFWPTGNPFDDQLILGKEYGPEFEEPARQIIGVVADVHNGPLDAPPLPVVYVPMAQVTDGVTALVGRVSSLAWIVRTRVTPGSISPAIQNELQKASGGLPVAYVFSMDEVVAKSTAATDFKMSLMTIFGAAALLLAAIGIYGLMAYSVRQRTQELGIRMALGAGAGEVRNMILFQGMRMALAGVVIGEFAAFGLTRFIASFLFGVTAWDPIVFTIVPVLLVGVAFLAVYIPAFRATRIDPIQALRCD